MTFWGVVGLAIWVAILSGLGLIIRRYLRVTHRLSRLEQHREQQRRVWWPYLPPHELQALLTYRRIRTREGLP